MLIARFNASTITGLSTIKLFFYEHHFQRGIWSVFVNLAPMGTGGNAKDPNRLAAWHNCLSALPTLLYAKWNSCFCPLLKCILQQEKEKHWARFKMGLIWHKILQVSIISSSPFPLGSAGFKWNRWKALALISVRHLAHDGTGDYHVWGCSLMSACQGNGRHRARKSCCRGFEVMGFPYHSRQLWRFQTFTEIFFKV